MFGMLFHGELQSYSSTKYKQNTKPESKWQEVIGIIECYKGFHLYGKFLTSSPYSRVRPNREEDTTQSAFTCSKLTIETLEQGVKYVQS